MLWLLKRTAISVLLVWVVASIVFAAIRLVPGDPAELLSVRAGRRPIPPSSHSCATSSA